MSLLVEEKVVQPRVKVKKVHTTVEAVKKEKAVHAPEDHRFERKFFVSDLAKPEILSLIKLHPMMFSEIYHERFVNNIYFDSFDLENYFATVDGLGRRRKCRIRWYGDLLGRIERPVLELKIKEGFVGRKESHPLAPFSLDESYRFGTTVEVFKNSELPAKLKLDLISLQPTLLNRYRRRYFQSANRQYRITVDTDLEFYRLKPHSNTFLDKWIDRENVIVELKYANAKDPNADLISRHFPFRVTKSSKYIMGVERVYM
jgi:SPX domain protein involved in polyphosphate accumulation